MKLTKIVAQVKLAFANTGKKTTKKAAKKEVKISLELVELLLRVGFQPATF